MILHNPNQPDDGDDNCTVCGWSARECPDAFSHIYHNAKMIFICSSKCMEAFQREPDRFAATVLETTEQSSLRSL